MFDSLVKIFWSALLFEYIKQMYSKTCVKQSHSKRQKLTFKTNYRLMQVKSIAECSNAISRSKVLQNAQSGAFCNTFDLYRATNCY